MIEVPGIAGTILYGVATPDGWGEGVVPIESVIAGLGAGPIAPSKAEDMDGKAGTAGFAGAMLIGPATLMGPAKFAGLATLIGPLTPFRLGTGGRELVFAEDAYAIV